MVEILQQDRTLISINRAQPAVLPIVVTELERHPLGTQAFVPMNGEALWWWLRQEAMSRT